MGAGAHHDPAAPGAIGLADTAHAVDESGGREIRPRHDLHQLLDPDQRVVDERQTGIDDLAQIVRRDIGRHADRDAGRTVDQQIRKARRQHRRLMLGIVVVGREIDGILVQIVQQCIGDAHHAHLGVTHGRRRVAVHRTEVALPVHQQVAQRKGLRHAHHGVVDRRVAVRVILTHDVADHARGFAIGAVPDVALLMHGEEHAPVHRLEPVAHVRKRPAHDHAHGVIEIGPTHLVLEIDGQNFFGEIWHGRDEPTLSVRRETGAVTARGLFLAA